MSVQVLAVGQLSLPELATEANREHGLCEQAQLGAITHAWHAGESLIAAKAQVRHGDWLPWLEANFAGDRTTAWRYMTLRERYPDVAHVQHLSSREALKQLSAAPPRERPEPPPPAPPREAFAGETFDVLYVDPPWRYEHVKTQSRAIENQYPTMSAGELAALEPPAADDAVMFMWATSPKLAEALDLLSAWDFAYRTCAVWVKDKIGMGYYFRQRHELLLVAVCGTPGVPSTTDRSDSVIEAPRLQHSAKPHVVYELIEAMYPVASRVELFARSDRPGWAGWGNEVRAAA